jgi:hypothetical protein
MKFRELEESSGYSFEGSWTPDLVFSKLWLAQELKNILADNQVDTVPVIYVLGSWWGNMSVILNRAAVPVDKIINVDNNRKWLKGSQQLTRAMNINNVQTMKADANQLDYRQSMPASMILRIVGGLSTFPTVHWLCYRVVTKQTAKMFITILEISWINIPWTLCCIKVQ